MSGKELDDDGALVWTGWSGEACRESEQVLESSEEVSHRKVAGRTFKARTQKSKGKLGSVADTREVRVRGKDTAQETRVSSAKEGRLLDFKWDWKSLEGLCRTVTRSDLYFIFLVVDIYFM